MMKPFFKAVCAAALAVVCIASSQGQEHRHRERLPEIDARRVHDSTPAEDGSDARASAAATVQTRLPEAKVDWHGVTGSPKLIEAPDGFLTGANGSGRAVSEAAARAVTAKDSLRPMKTFLTEHRALFGHGPEALDAAPKKHDYTDPHNGLRTVAWQQTVDDIPVFEALLKAHITSKGELVNIGSGWVRDGAAAAEAGMPNRAALVPAPRKTASEALAIAGVSVDPALDAHQMGPSAAPAEANQRQPMAAAGLSDATAELAWLALDENSMRLCWQTVFSHTARGEMFLALVDVETGELLLRRNLTNDISNASYRVFTSDSPTPFSPGHAAPSTVQPAQAARTLVTTPALNTTASPNGWIDDGVNETRGNNVDAHTDTNADNIADTPRPQGTNRVFDFTLDLTQAPSTYKNAAVTQLFYWCNFMHDKLYELGFTEASGNFQNNNFGKGGVGNDAVQADAQDGSGTENANFSTPPDGSPGRMQMYLFTGPTPDRDGDFDAEIILHEYTHGLTNRLVGGGVGISALQTGGMGEGWSDFYGLTLLAEAGDNVNANYASGGYATYLLDGLFSQNYYSGIRRYPYSTNLAINPLTYKDIDPTKASAHTGIPRSTVIGNTANEVHNMGEVWCVTLWEVRANLVTKHGFATGNQLTLQLVTDGLKLAPANPTFLQARNAIIQADQVLTGGANKGELWAAFAKRGMGASATSPASTTATGVFEAFDVPDDLSVAPINGLSFSGVPGGPFSPFTQSFTLTNNSATPLNWTATKTQTWLSISATGGTLAPGGTVEVFASVNPTAITLAAGAYSDTVTFRNTGSGITQPRAIGLTIAPLPVLAFPLDTNPGWTMQGQWAFGHPIGGGGGSHGSPDPANGATGANVIGVNLAGDYSTAIAGPYYVTTPALNLSGVTSTRLQFQRWLNTDYESFAYATIDVSNNGTTWTRIWENGSSEVADAAWELVTYDISALADNKPTVYVRWGYQTGTGVWAYSGWNIDDIAILGTPATDLTITLPSTIREGDAALTGTITATPAPSTNLTVALTASAPGRLTVPATVIIPAGAKTATFPVVAVNDVLLNGSLNVTVTPVASGWGVHSGTILVTDNESATLSVSLPASAAEGGGSVFGTVTASAAPAVAVTVQLVSNKPADATVPATVTIAAGLTSATFALTPVNDTRIDGTQAVTVTASVNGWVSGSGTINITDNESTILAVSAPASVQEGNTGKTASASISGTLPADLVVALSSSKPGDLAVPATVVIPAGQTSASFALTVVDDALLDGTQTAVITATAAGFTSGQATVSVLDNDAHHFGFGTIASTQVRGVAFPVTLTAFDASNAPITNFSGSVALSATSSAGLLPVLPAAASGFVNGVWTGAVTISSFATNVQLIASDTGGHTGTSNAFAVAAGALDHFAWANIPGSPTMDSPFPVTVTAVDAGNNTVAGFNGSADLALLSGVTGQPTGTGTSYWYSSFDGYYPKSRVQSIYLASELGGAGRMTGVALNFLTPSTQPYTVNVRLKHTTATAVSTASWDASGWTLVYQASFTPSPAGWVTLNFSNPFDYNGTSNLLFDLSIDNTVANSSYAEVSATSGSTVRTVYGYTTSAASSPLTWSGTTGATPYSTYSVLNLRFDVEKAFPVRPAQASFSSGVASAQVSVPFAAGSVRLRAADAAGHTGASNTFSVGTPVPPANGSGTIFSDNFESGTLGPAWTVTGTGTYRTRASNLNTPHAGSYHMTMDNGADDGNYARNEATLTLNLAGRTGVVLAFWAKMFDDDADAPPASPFPGGANFDGVAISADGNTWYEVQSLRSPAITNSYAQFTVNLDSVIAARGLSYNSAFKIRFNQYDNYAIATDGIAIDDVLVTGTPLTALTITAPAQVSEAAGSVSATVTLPAVQAGDVTVSLSSNSPAKISVPASVIIPAGQLSGTFALTVLDDALLDGNKTVGLSASAPGIFPGSAFVQVQDNETTTMTISAPATLVENAAAVQGTITLAQAALGTITVALSSSDPTAVQVPATVSFSPGQSVASFTLTPVDDIKIDGTQTATITASYPGWSSAAAQVNVTDNEARTFTISGGTTVSEGTSTTRTLSLSGTYASDLTVSLVSSNPARLAVPASVTVPAGSLGVIFNDTAIDNLAADGTAAVTITASAPAFTTSTLGVSVYDNDVLSFSLGSMATQKSGVAFYVSISALSAGSSIAYGFNGPVALTASGGTGPVTVAPATITLTSGQWSGYLTCVGVGTAVKLAASSGAITSSSNAFILQGSPKVGVAPASVSATVLQGSTASVPVTISNSGAAALTWSIGSAASAQAEVLSEGPAFTGTSEVPKSEAPAASAAGPADPAAVYREDRAPEPSSASATALPLATVLANLNLSYNAIRSAIPNRYAFSEGVAGSYISDGGGDMYDTGNYLNTNLASSLAYSDGVIATHSGFGSGGQYFTRKYDGLWVFAADVNALSYFETAGDLGADSGGSTDTAVLSTVRDGITYRGFVKRVYGTSDPSVNHLMIVADNGTASQLAATDTNDDYHRLTNLTGVTRVYYLLYAGSSGAYIDNTSTLGIMAAFLDAMSGSDWLSVSPPSGTVAVGSSQTVTLSLGLSSLGQGSYFRNLVVASNDPLTAQVTLPVSLNVQGEGVLQVNPALAAPVTGSRGGPFTPASQVFTLTNGGAKPLAWTASKTAAWHDLDVSSGTLSPGASVTITGAMNAAANQLAGGSYSSTVTFTNTTTGLGNTTRAIGLTVTPAAELSITPADDFNIASTYPGLATPSSRVYALKNVGDATLNWTASDNATWLSLNGISGTLAAGASFNLTATAVSTSLPPGAYVGVMTFTNTTNGRGSATRRANFSVGLAAPVLNPEPAITPATSNTIGWKTSSGATGYEAQYATDPNFTDSTDSPVVVVPSYTFTNLADSTQYYYRVRARRPQAAQTSSWNQTSLAQFATNALTNVSVSALSGSVVLALSAATTQTATEAFDEATSGFVDTAFPDAPSGFTREVATAGPNATPPLPVNQGTDLVARGGGGPAFALRDATKSTNLFSSGLIDAYLAPRDRTATQDAGLLIRATRTASGVNGYAAVIRFYPDGTAKPDLARVVNGSYDTGFFNTTPYAFALGANENVRVRLSGSGTSLSLSMWRVSVVGGTVTETPIAIGPSGATTLTATDSTYTTGVPGLLQKGPASTAVFFDDVTYTQPVPASYAASGSMLSTLIAPAPFARWGALAFSKVAADPGTAVTVDVLDASGTLLAADVASGTDLNTIGAVASQTSLRLRANFAAANPLYTPRLDDWTVQYVTIADGTVYSAWSATETSYQFNAPPGITSIADQLILEDGATAALPFTLSDDSTAPAQLALAVSSSNASLVKPGGIALLGTGANRTIQVTPVPDQFGGAVISIQATDEGAKSTTRSFAVFVKPVNDAPAFTHGADIALLENAGPQSLPGWASNLSSGPANEAAQTLNFIVSNDNPALFSVPPAIAPDGTLSFTPAAHGNGLATITVRARDDGGTADGGVDSTAPQSFTVSIAAINDAPVFTKGADVAVREDAGPQTIAGWATQISAGPADESAQALDFIVTSDNEALFATPPVIAADGTLRFTTAHNANGSALVTVRLHDAGGNDNGGSDTSAPQTFKLTVTAVNDAPEFIVGANLETARSAGPQLFSRWATHLSSGPSDEAAQALGFRVTVDDASLFAVAPSITPDGTLTYAPAPLATGTATVTVRLRDDGGTDDGGIDLSAPQTFTIAVTTFLEETGTYNGLVAAAPSVAPAAERVGLVRMTLRPNGGFTGKLVLGGVATPFKGKVDESGVAHFGKASSPTLAIPRRGGALPLALSFKVDVARGTDSLAGAILADGAEFSAFSADRAVFGSDAPTPLTLPAAMPGAYTFMISARPSTQQTIAPAETPLGYGCGTLTLTAAGRVRVAGWLADGTAFSYANDLSKNHVWPFYHGSPNGYAITGPAAFRDLPGVSDFNTDNLLWFRSGKRAGLYRAGWPQGLQADLLGSRFTGKPGAALLQGLFPGRPGGNATVHLWDGGLADPGLSTALTVETSYRVIVPGLNPDGVAVRINPLTGIFTGRFMPPGAHRPAPFRGVFLQKQNLGAGAFRTRTSTGEVTLSPQ